MCGRRATSMILRRHRYPLGDSPRAICADFVIPLILMSVGLGLANGPASSASTSAVSADQVGAAAGISNMARYIGGALAVAAAATVSSSATANQLAAGASDPDALAFGLSRSALLLTLMSGAGVGLAFLMISADQRHPSRSAGEGGFPG
jgi:hypothetical protein